jgi:hypothetical protein
MPGVLVGHEHDFSECPDASPEDRKGPAAEHALVDFEVSAKNGRGIVGPFKGLAEKFITLCESEADQFTNAA